MSIMQVSYENASRVLFEAGWSGNVEKTPSWAMCRRAFKYARDAEDVQWLILNSVEMWNRLPADQAVKALLSHGQVFSCAKGNGLEACDEYDQLIRVSCLPRVEKELLSLIDRFGSWEDVGYKFKEGLNWEMMAPLVRAINNYYPLTVTLSGAADRSFDEGLVQAIFGTAGYYRTASSQLREIARIAALPKVQHVIPKFEQTVLPKELQLA